MIALQQSFIICSHTILVFPYGDSASLIGEFSVIGCFSASPYTVQDELKISFSESSLFNFQEGKPKS